MKGLHPTPVAPLATANRHPNRDRHTPAESTAPDRPAGSAVADDDGPWHD